MTLPLPAAAGPPLDQEREHLERAHDEICTALTILRSNADLIRIDLRRSRARPMRRAIDGHLAEVELAVDRLKRLAVELRSWHAGAGGELPRDLGALSDGAYFPQGGDERGMEHLERAAAPLGGPRASARIRTSAGQLGFSPPPALLRLKLVEGPYHWSLYLQSQTSSRIGALVEWLEPWSPLRIEFGSRKVLRADFDPLPSAWLERFRSVELQMLNLYPSGAAVASVVGTHVALATFGRMLSGTASPDVRQVNETPRDRPLLTRAQDEALRAAVEAGYYRIPRPVNLQQLAAKMHTSPASLSERLRRAEGRVILRYAREGAVSPWDARTLFDPSPLEDATEDPAHEQGPR